MKKMFRRIWVTDEDGQTKRYERQVWPLVDNPRQFVTRLYGEGRKLVVSTEKQRPGEYCRPYTMYT